MCCRKIGKCRDGVLRSTGTMGLRRCPLGWIGVLLRGNGFVCFRSLQVRSFQVSFKVPHFELHSYWVCKFERFAYWSNFKLLIISLILSFIQSISSSVRVVVCTSATLFSYSFSNAPTFLEFCFYFLIISRHSILTNTLTTLAQGSI